MLQLQHVHKSYGITTILHDIGFVLNAGEHVGLVGANGAGKSTLLRCIAGLEQPDQGTITLVPGARPGYLPQALTDSAARTLGEAIALAQAEARTAEQNLQQAAEALASAHDPDAALAAYDTALARFEALGGYAYEQQAAAVLDGLGLSIIEPTTLISQLSGGQKTRLGLATLLLGNPDLLLLDEPTNHLDVAALEWLEGFVQGYPGAVLVASHDREFLDRTTSRTLFLDPLSRTLRSYPGSYSDFAAARAQEREQQLADYKRQQEYVAQVEADIARMKGYALGLEHGSTPKDHDAKFFLDQKIGAKRLAQKARARERKLERYLASEERVEKPRSSWGLKLDFGQPPSGGRAVLRVEDLAFGYQAQNDLLFQQLSFEVAYGERVALVGPNGAGKTTLLRLIAGELQPTHGTIRLSSGVKLGLMAQEQDTLDPRRTVIDHVLRARALGETEARTFLHQFLFGGDSVFRRISECSYGERSRLQLALLVLQGCNLLLLDEPLNHLDIDGREHFEAALDAYAGTVIVVAHDRAFLRSFAERLIEVKP